jgi:transposase
MRPAHPLRVMTSEEERTLQHTAKATSQRVDVVKRARALLAVRAGHSYTQAAHQEGYKSGDSVSQLVERFNQQGRATLHIATGRGRKARYTPAQRERILAQLQRVPERTHDGTATWSLKTLERALRQTGDLPQLSATTIRMVLHEAGYRYGKTRTWCATGTAIRVRQGGTVTVHDPKTQEKNS